MRGCAISIGAIVAFLLYGLMMPIGVNPSPVISWGVIVLVYLVLPGGICLEIVDFARRRRTIEKGPSLEPLRERIITEKVLVICPFCGAKNEQGITKCGSCGAEI